MARSGIGGQVGIATETTYGTAVTPNTFLPVESESFRLNQEYIRTQGIRAGRLVQASGQHTATTRTVEGGFPLMFQSKGMGKLLNQLNGDVNAPTTPGGGTLSRLFTFNIGTSSPEGKSLTVQAGRPDVNGTTRPFTYAGVKVTQAVFSCERGGVLASEWTFDGADETTATSLATATYPSAASEFSFLGASIELDDAVVLDCVRSASVTLPFAYDTERFCFGTNGVKKEPITNGMIAPTIELEAEFASLTQHNAYRAATRRKIELIFQGPLIEGSIYHQFKITVPTTVTVGAGPVIEGMDVISQTLSLEALDSGSGAPVVLEWTTTDTAL